VVAGEAADGREAVRLVRSENPDVAVLDISMPQFNGLNAALELARVCPRVKLVVLTQHDEPQYVTEALRCGVRGYVLKSQAARDLVQAIEGVCRGEVYLSPGVAGAVAEAYLSPQHAAAALSVRERQVLQLIAEGHSTKAIAARLAISAKTVESHRSKLMQKLDIHDTASLVRYAIPERNHSAVGLSIRKFLIPDPSSADPQIGGFALLAQHTARLCLPPGSTLVRHTHDGYRIGLAIRRTRRTPRAQCARITRPRQCGALRRVRNEALRARNAELADQLRAAAMESDDTRTTRLLSELLRLQGLTKDSESPCS